MLKSSRVKNVASALAVAGGGFVLLNLTFGFYALIFQFFNLFRRGEAGPEQGIPMVRGAVFLVIIALISWLVFRSKLPVLVKAIYLTVPTAVALVTIGISLNTFGILPYLLGGIITVAVLYLFYRTHQPWLYYYTVILVALTLAIYTLTGGEI